MDYNGKHAKTYSPSKCAWLRCHNPGIYFSGRIVGKKTRWGYYCSNHEAEIREEVVENERLERERRLEVAREWKPKRRVQ